jgi:hypothetical protein
MEFVSCSKCKYLTTCEWAKTFMMCRKFSCADYKPNTEEKS